MRKKWLNCVQKGQSRDCIRRLIIMNCQTLTPEFNFLSVPYVGYTPRIFNLLLLTAYLRIDDKVWCSTLNDKHSDCPLKVSGKHGLNDIHNTIHVRYLLAPRKQRRVFEMYLYTSFVRSMLRAPLAKEMRFIRQSC